MGFFWKKVATPYGRAPYLACDTPTCIATVAYEWKGLPAPGNRPFVWCRTTRRNRVKSWVQGGSHRKMPKGWIRTGAKSEHKFWCPKCARRRRR